MRIYEVPILKINSLSIQSGGIGVAFLNPIYYKVKADSKPLAALRVKNHPDCRKNINEVTKEGQFYLDSNRKIR